MIVIGGKNSSNTKQLFSIAAENCPDSYHIECEDDLDPTWFRSKKLCGISAGASTPDWIIQKVIEKIEKIGKNQKIQRAIMLWSVSIFIQTVFVIFLKRLNLRLEVN